MKRFFFIVGVFVIAMTVSAPRVFAFSLVDVEFSSGGVIDVTSLPTSGCADGIFAGARFYYGLYPDTSTLNETLGFGPVIDNCQTLFAGFSGNMETWEDSGDGDYFMLFGINGDTPPTSGNYIFSATRSGGVWSAGSNPLATRFLSYELSTTTQTFNVDYYISADDLAFDSGISVNFNVSTPIYSNWNQDTFIATSSGFGSYSFIYQNFSTSTLDIFTFSSSITGSCEDPFSATCNPRIYDSVSTTTNANGLGVSSTVQPPEIDELASINCNLGIFGGFNLSKCISYLLIPSRTQIDQNIQTIQSGFLTRVPLGYFTRFYILVSSTTTEPLPELNLPLGSFGSFDLTPWDYLLGPTSVLSTASSTLYFGPVVVEGEGTLRSITEPYWNFAWYLLLIFAIVSDLIGVGRTTDFKGRSDGVNINDYGGAGNRSYGPNRGDFNQSK